MAAVSYSLGFSGRLNLIAVANEPFYCALGFVDAGEVKDGESLLELPAKAALSMLTQRGLFDEH
jgi:hypothetical protein